MKAQRASAAAVILAYLSLTTSGCMSVRARAGRTTDGPGGAVAVEVFADDSARRANRPGPAGLMGELQRKKAGHWDTVFRSMNPTWAVTGLPPGTYRVSFPARLDDAGNIVRMNPKVKSVAVKEGRVSEVEVVLDHVSTGLVVVGVIAAVAAAVVLSDFLSDHDLPLPPLPPPEFAEIAIQVSLDLAANAEWVAVSDSLPPVVTSHFPAKGARVAASRARVVFSLSEPLQAASVRSTAVTVMGEEAGIVPGVVSYDTLRWLIIWEPAEDLPRGDTLHVTLDPGQVEDLAGNEPVSPMSFTFSTDE
ncbi:MAG: Ig-like domain-containing protein [Acidobacteria bacterium]|nr:Ig-like domain-containing protein [Acidobacteriota bacterium]